MGNKPFRKKQLPFYSVMVAWLSNLCRGFCTSLGTFSPKMESLCRREIL